MKNIQWQWRKFSEFDAQSLYQLMALRQRVFVVEQACVYLDADGADVYTEHLTGFDGKQIVACLRLLPPHVRGPEAAVGRVAIDKQYRGKGMGYEIMRRAMLHIQEAHGACATYLAAQAHLASFYASFGFESDGEVYLEDGIDHIDMRRAADGD